MKLHYDSDTDSLYIDLADRPSAESVEVRPGIVIDMDAQGRVVGIDLDHASRWIDLPTESEQAVPFHRGGER